MKELPQIPNIDPQEETRKKWQRAETPLRNQESPGQKELTRYIFKWWQGDAHSHSTRSTREETGKYEGIYSIEEMMEYYEKLGLKFVAFAEHSSDPGNPRKLSPEDPISQSLVEEADEIEKINREGQSEIVALSSVETNIMFDENGQPIVDVPEEVLAKLDLIVASRHAIENEKDPAAIKKSLLAAINNKYVDIIGHPDRFTRKDKEKSAEYWEEYWGIWQEILDEMVAHNKVFEINLNSQPSRKLLEMAVKGGVKFCLNFDAHDFNQFKSEGTEVHGEKKKWAAGEADNDEIEILRKYKIERLTSGPGVRVIARLVRYLGKLESLGVTPDRIINSSPENLVKFLIEDRGKETSNLQFIKKKLKI
jgi:histidinol phosphatase-like PHP family hydrolase